MTRHVLKCWPESFDRIVSGAKRFEIRYDDRGYKDGDILHLRRYDPTREVYTGREVEAYVEYVMPLADAPISLVASPRLVAMSLTDVIRVQGTPYQSEESAMTERKD